MKAGTGVRLSLEGKLALLLLTAAASGAILALLLNGLLHSAWLLLAVVVVAGTIPVLLVARRALRPVRRVLRAMQGATESFRDGDFSVSLVVNRNDELGELLQACNGLGTALREQRSYLVQRELMLDTVTQNSPVALVLADAHQRVVYANLAARHLLNDGRTLLGDDFGAVLARAPEALRAAVAAGADSLFPVDMAGQEETLSLSQRDFTLQGRRHRLYLFKTLTRELSRQEVATWKKLIRVVSHELNNSLGPIASMAHTGAEVLRRGDTTALPAVFATIGERAAHLHQFVAGYTAFARLPAPQAQPVQWRELLAELARQQSFTVAGPLPHQPGWFDRSQLEQVLINLLKNAHEAGGDAAHVEVVVLIAGAEQVIEVRDRGPGMSEVVLAQALLPFYSTKRSGTGLGLALAREIAEAHGGRIRLGNREGGGLCVTLVLPLPPSAMDQGSSADQPSNVATPSNV